MANRFVYLCSHYGISPDRILCVSFTNKAVKELKDRIVRCWPAEIGMPFEDLLEVRTFHNVCMKIISDVRKSRGVEARKYIYHGTKFIKDILNNDYPELKAAYEITKIIEGLRWICKFEERDFTVEDLKKVGVRETRSRKADKVLERFPFQVIEEIYWKFDEKLRKNKVMTLDDILLEARLFLKEEAVLEHWASQWDAILCGEFQDVDEVQFEVLTKLCKNHQNIFCVCEFWGVRPKAFDDLESHFRGLGYECQIYKMEQNFRSTPQILNLSNQLISFHKGHNKFRKNLYTENSEGSIPQIYVASSESAQAEGVVKKIEELTEQGVNLKDIAILGRNRSYYSHEVKTALFCSKIRYHDLKERYPLIEHQEIKFLMYWLNVAFLDETDKNWINSLSKIYNIPAIKVGSTKFGRCMVEGQSLGSYIKAFEKEGQSDKNIYFLSKKINYIREIAKDSSKSLHEKCLSIANASGIKEHYIKKEENRNKKIDKFINGQIFKDTEDWDIVLNQLDSFLFGTKKDRVTCSTIHGVKGLEFEHVIVVNVSEGRLPSKVGLDMCTTPDQTDKYIDEERRLMYVACTRAKKSLHIFSDSDSVSPFIHDIESCSEKGVFVAESFIKPLFDREEGIDDLDHGFISEEVLDVS